MFTTISLFVSFILLTLDITLCLKIQPAVIRERDGSTCPTSSERVRYNVSQQASAILSNLVLVPECGPGNWMQVASLNMNDSQQNCPSPWVLETTPARSCAAARPPCASVFYHTLGTIYQKVCGMALGYATTSPDGFLNRNSGIDANYLDGVSITYGQPRQHIWSLAVGHDNSVYSTYRCPCDNPNRGQAPLPPSFVGENYFCDSDHVNGAVWDGEGCTNDCCSFHSPPWFVAPLTAPTSDNIEARICHDQAAADERIYLSSLSLFVQ